MFLASNKQEVQYHRREMAAGVQSGFGEKFGVWGLGNMVWMEWE